MRSLLKDIPDSQMVGHTLYKGIYYLDPELQKKLCDAMISLPKVFPGDTVWWHCDLIHSYVIEQIFEIVEKDVVIKKG